MMPTRRSKLRLCDKDYPSPVRKVPDLYTMPACTILKSTLRRLPRLHRSPDSLSVNSNSWSSASPRENTLPPKPCSAKASPVRDSAWWSPAAYESSRVLREDASRFSASKVRAARSRSCRYSMAGAIPRPSPPATTLCSSLSASRIFRRSLPDPSGSGAEGVEGRRIAFLPSGGDHRRTLVHHGPAQAVRLPATAGAIGRAGRSLTEFKWCFQPTIRNWPHRDRSPTENGECVRKRWLRAKFAGHLCGAAQPDSGLAFIFA